MQNDEWSFLQNYTPARIARGRAGHSLPTNELLKFQADHARARDAVYSELDTDLLKNTLETQLLLETILLESKVQNRQEFLQRPDRGRFLNEDSGSFLKNREAGKADICFVIADGLSAKAVNTHALPVLEKLIPHLQKLTWKIAPVCLVKQGRVAIGDEIAFLLKAEIVVIFIGERPGLSSPDSMGAYLTFKPQAGLTDESRNCISNIRPEGLNYDFAMQKLLYLLTEMKSRKLSGVNLKDGMEEGQYIED